MKLGTLAAVLIGGTIALVVGYAVLLIAFEWPVSDYSVETAAVFGDSFGVLTSLFSGLAFAGLIITILLQKDELALQRKELEESRKSFQKSAHAQERSAQLAALGSLLDEYDLRILEKRRRTGQGIPLAESITLKREIINLVGKKSAAVGQIEAILAESGIDLSPAEPPAS